MTDQPRDDKGRFTRIDHRNAEFNEDKTIGTYPAEDISDSVEFVGVDIELLERAIEDAKEFDEIVRIGTMSKKDKQDGEIKENGIVCLKGSPSDTEAVAVSGLEWTYDGESNE